MYLEKNNIIIMFINKGYVSLSLYANYWLSFIQFLLKKCFEIYCFKIEKVANHKLLYFNSKISSITYHICNDKKKTIYWCIIFFGVKYCFNEFLGAIPCFALEALKFQPPTLLFSLF